MKPSPDELWTIPPYTGRGEEVFLVRLYHIRWKITLHNGDLFKAERNTPWSFATYTPTSRSLTLTYNDPETLHTLDRAIELGYIPAQSFQDVPIVKYESHRFGNGHLLRLNMRNRCRLRTLLMQLGTLSYHEGVAPQPSTDNGLV